MSAPPDPDSGPPGGGRFDEAGDATRRTHLATERTLLAWWRTGLTALGVSLAVGRVVPDLTHATRWPYAILGAAYGLLGLAMVVFGTVRHRQVEDAIMTGRFLRPDRRVVAAFTVLAVAIAIGTVALVVAEP